MIYPHRHAVADDSNELVRQALCVIAEYGDEYLSSELSMNNGNLIKEVFNTSMVWRQPRRRLYTPPLGLPPFRLGLAVARFFYLLSGSNHLAPIAFYSPSVSRFSDDGITIPGSSYGHRIFGQDKRGGQFEKIAQLILNRENTKRAEIAIYHPDDAGRESKDIPCATALVFMPRGDDLHMTLQMRANDVARLLPYNLFEFSLLMECMAAQTGLTLGEFHHTAVSLHLRGAETALTLDLSETEVSLEMLPITTFSHTLRLQLVETEHLIRTHISHQGKVPAWEWFKTLTHFEPAWRDLLGALLLEALRCVQSDMKDILWLKDRMLEDMPEAVTINAYGWLPT